MSRGNRVVRPGLALVLSFNLACSGGSPPAAPPQTGQNLPAPATLEESQNALAGARQAVAALNAEQGTPASAAQLRDWMEQGFNDLDTAERDVRRDTFDVSAAAKAIGSDPAKIFAWVRDDTFFVPYRGLLRGATGVLMDRFGNSLDRALLLTELLKQHGIATRFAHARLTADQAAAVLRTPRPAPSRRAVDTAAPLGPQELGALAAYASSKHLDRGRVQKVDEQLSSAAESVARGATQRAANQAAAIVKLLSNAPASSSSNALAIEAVRDHWWVQIQQQSGWQDLDPATPDAVVGRPLVPAAETTTAVPSDLYHQISVRVVIERRTADAKYEESVVVDQPIRPQEVWGQRILLQHRPVNWPANPQLQGEQGRQNLETALLALNEWQPVLTVGSTTTARGSFTDAGTINAKPGTSTAGPAGGAFGGLFDGLGGDSEPSASGGELTAEWIEYEIRSPGRPIEKIRRSVFDVIGPAARAQSPGSIGRPTTAQRLRRALALLGQTDILPLNAQLSPDFVRHLMYTTLAGQREAVLSLIASADAGAERLIESAGKLNAIPGELYGFALARTAFSPVTAVVYLDRPNIVTYHVGIRQNEKGEFVRTNSFDIVSNEVAVSPASDRTMFETRLVQGVVDTMAEALAVGHCQECGAIQNVSDAWAADPRASTTWVAVRDVHDSSWRGLNLKADTRLQVEADLRAGYLVVLPSSRAAAGTSFGWWRIDPQSGTTLGMMESGQGQGLLETVLRENVVRAALYAGVLQFAGCGGFSAQTSEKVVACAGCGLFTAWATAATVLSIGVSAVATASAVAAGFMVNNVCNVISAKWK